MKKQIMLAVVGASALLACQPKEKETVREDFKVTGNLTGLTTDKIIINYTLGDSSVLDTVAVANSVFTFVGRVNEPTQATIMSPDRKLRFALYLENTDIDVAGNVDSLAQVKITGSATQDELVAFNESKKEITDRMNALNNEYRKLDKSDTAAVSALRAEYMSLVDKDAEMTKAYIQNNPGSYIALNALKRIIGDMEYEEMNTAYNNLDSALQQSSGGQQLAKTIDIAGKTRIGQPAMNFTQNDVDGNPVSLSDFKGKYVLVDFWASWCGPCRAENPNVVAAYNKYKEKGFDILGVSLDQDGDKWKQAIEKDKLTWSHVSDLKGWGNEASKMYGVRGIPANYLLNPEGVIIAKNLRGAALEAELEKALAAM